MVRVGEPVTRFETQRLRKDGSSFDASLTYSPVVAQDKIIAISAIARDISERKQFEEDRAQQARLLQLSLDAIIVWNYANGAIEYWNEGAEKLYGYTAGEVFGRSVHDGAGDRLSGGSPPRSRKNYSRPASGTGGWCIRKRAADGWRC